MTIEEFRKRIMDRIEELRKQAQAEKAKADAAEPKADK